MRVEAIELLGMEESDVGINDVNAIQSIMLLPDQVGIRIIETITIETLHRKL